MIEQDKGSKKHVFSVDEMEGFTTDSTFVLKETGDVVTFVEWKENFKLNLNPGLNIKFPDGRTMIVIASELKKAD